MSWQKEKRWTRFCGSDLLHGTCYPQLPGDNLETANKFYMDGLGFHVIFEATEDGTTGLLRLERDGILLTIDSLMSGHGRDACVAFEVGER